MTVTPPDGVMASVTAQEAPVARIMKASVAASVGSLSLAAGFLTIPADVVVGVALGVAATTGVAYYVTRSPEERREILASIGSLFRRLRPKQ